MLMPDKKTAAINVAGDNVIAVVDVASGQIMRKVPNGQVSVRSALHSDGRFAYTPERDQDTVSMYDTRNWELVKTVSFPAGSQPYMLRVSHDGKEVWVQSGKVDTNVVLNAEDLSTLATLPTGKGPVTNSWTPDGKLSVVSNSGDTFASVFDALTYKEVARLMVGQGASNIGFTRDGSDRIHVGHGRQLGGGDRHGQIDRGDTVAGWDAAAGTDSALARVGWRVSSRPNAQRAGDARQPNRALFGPTCWRRHGAKTRSALGRAISPSRKASQAAVAAAAARLSSGLSGSGVALATKTNQVSASRPVVGRPRLPGRVPPASASSDRAPRGAGDIAQQRVGADGRQAPSRRQAVQGEERGVGQHEDGQRDADAAEAFRSRCRAPRMPQEPGQQPVAGCKRHVERQPHRARRRNRMSQLEDCQPHTERDRRRKNANSVASS